MTPIRVLAATAGAVLAAIVLIVVGVALLVGVPWALIAAGVLLAVAALTGSYVLLRDDEKPAKQRRPLLPAVPGRVDGP